MKELFQEIRAENDENPWYKTLLEEHGSYQEFIDKYLNNYQKLIVNKIIDDDKKGKLKS